MRSDDEQTPVSESNSFRELRLLSEVQRRPGASQRELAKRVGIALGMTNLLLHNLAQKGYVRISQAGWRRWLYGLTPEGFARKIQLTLDYIHRFVDQYRKVRQTLRDELALEQLNAESRVAIYGTGEFAELVYLGLKDLGIEEIEVFDRSSIDGNKFLGMPVREMSNFQSNRYDRVVVAFLGEAKKQYSELRQAGVPPEKMVFFFANSEVLPVSEAATDEEQLSKLQT